MIDRGERDKAKIELTMARDVILAVKDDPATPYTKPMYVGEKDHLQEIEEKLSAI